MKFWDTSAIVPLLADEPAGPQMLALMRSDVRLVVSFLTPLEVKAAISRRNASLDSRRSALTFMDALRSAWTVVDDYAEIVAIAGAMIRKYGLRAGDAIQLASALVACGRRPKTLPFVSRDLELATAARAEGFPTLP